MWRLCGARCREASHRQSLDCADTVAIAIAMLCMATPLANSESRDTLWRLFYIELLPGLGMIGGIRVIVGRIPVQLLALKSITISEFETFASQDEANPSKTYRKARS